MALHLGSSKNLKICSDNGVYSFCVPVEKILTSFSVFVDDIEVCTVLAKIARNAPTYDNTVEVK